MKILMVCLGNICRSPLAEGILQGMANQAGLNWIVDSAGTNGYHDGEAPHRLSQKVALLHGVDISKQISRKITKDDIAQYDLIYAMAKDVLEDIKYMAGKHDDSSKIKLFLDELPLLKNKNVPDPWYGGEEGYHEVYALLKEGCKLIVEKYK